MHPLELAPVQPQRGPLLLAEGLLGDRGRDVGVPVPVTPDPAPEGEEVGHREDLAGPGPLQGQAEAGLHLWHEVEQGLLEVVQAAADLVEDGGLRVPGVLGLPEGDDELTEPGGLGIALVGRQRAGVQPLEGLRHLRELQEHRPALGLRGVGGEDRHHRQPRDQRARLVGQHPLVPKPHEGGLHGLGHRSVLPPRLVGTLAEDPDALLLLGQVDEGEVAGEGLDHPLGLGQRQRLDAGQKPRPRLGVSRPVRLGQAAHILDQVEEGLSLLLDDGLPEEVAEPVNLLAKVVAVVHA